MLLLMSYCQISFVYIHSIDRDVVFCERALRVPVRERSREKLEGEEKAMLKIHLVLTAIVRRVLLVLSMLMLIVALFAGMQGRAAAADAWSFVRIFHASPDIGTVDVFMDGNKLLSNFQYGTLTAYTPVAAGMHTLQLAAIGTGVDAAVLTRAFALQAGTPYTVVALGTKATGLSLRIFADNNQVASNLAKVRFYDMSPGTGVVDVSEQGNMLINGLPYAQASNYVSIPPGSYTFSLTSSQENMRASVSVQLKAWTVTSIFAINALNNGTIDSQLQFVQSQITGMPGMPGTGSDPYVTAEQPSLPISCPPVILLALCSVSAGTIAFFCRARGKTLTH